MSQLMERKGHKIKDDGKFNIVIAVCPCLYKSLTDQLKRAQSIVDKLPLNIR